MKLFSRSYGAGPPVVILHGLFGMLDNWLTVAKALSEHYTVWLIDQRNHGQSPHSDEFNYELMSGDLAEFFDDHSIPEAVVIGHSMGGKTAMFFATQHPQLCSRLVVADIAPHYYPVHHEKILRALSSVRFENVKSRKEVEEVLAKTITDSGERKFLMKNLYWKTDHELGWRMNLPVLSQKIEEVGKALPEDALFDKEALFIRGEKSNYITEAAFQQALKHFPKAELTTVPGAGHWMHAENLAGFLEALKRFMKF